MFSSCLFCSARLGVNDQLPTFPVGRRIAFDAKMGRLWVICTSCARWNLTPLEERWEAIETCERLFRGTRLRVSTDNIGLTRLRYGLELVRIGPALLPEIASWRYGSRLQPYEGEHAPRPGLVLRGSRFIARATAGLLVNYATSSGLSDETVLRMRVFRREHSVLTRSVDESGRTVVIRYAHLRDAQLIRPDRDQPWRVQVAHDEGTSTLIESHGLRAAGKLLATLNFGVASAIEVQHAVAKLDDAGDPNNFFTRIASLVLRTSWGRFPDAPEPFPGLDVGAQRSQPERLALSLANRSFWGRGSTTSEAQTALYRLPAVDRLALEMASNEDVERRAMHGELAALHSAWKEAEEIAVISDELFSDEVFEEFKRQYLVRQAEMEQ
ncbi:MAG: hypothetical protein H7Z40_07350 [Phycisphaerae bacterium]|nr:hypothetical protein [Gemmatimonadaceae bacterium]